MATYFKPPSERHSLSRDRKRLSGRGDMRWIRSKPRMIEDRNVNFQAWPVNVTTPVRDLPDREQLVDAGVVVPVEPS